MKMMNLLSGIKSPLLVSMYFVLMLKSLLVFPILSGVTSVKAYEAGFPRHSVEEVTTEELISNASKRKSNETDDDQLLYGKIEVNFFRNGTSNETDEMESIQYSGGNGTKGKQLLNAIDLIGHDIGRIFDILDSEEYAESHQHDVEADKKHFQELKKKIMAQNSTIKSRSADDTTTVANNANGPTMQYKSLDNSHGNDNSADGNHEKAKLLTQPKGKEPSALMLKSRGLDDSKAKILWRYILGTIGTVIMLASLGFFVLILTKVEPDGQTETKRTETLDTKSPSHKGSLSVTNERKSYVQSV